MKLYTISLALTATLAAAQTSMPALGKSPVAFGPKPAGCSKFEILVARGTSEPGSFGLIVGDPLVRAVKAQVPGARGYAVQYPADMSAASVTTGVKDVVDRLTSQSQACPEQKFALVGYSQGAMVMHAAAPKIPQDVVPKIAAFVMFGDPLLRRGSGKFPGSMAEKTYENCAPGDMVCASPFNIQT
jgi:cutinase